jgi:hypothetical protein
MISQTKRENKIDLETATWGRSLTSLSPRYWCIHARHTAVMHSFNKDPETRTERSRSVCPDCGSRKQLFIVYSSFSRAVISHIKKEYSLKNGYFRPKSPP